MEDASAQVTKQRLFLLPCPSDCCFFSTLPFSAHTLALSLAHVNPIQGQLEMDPARGIRPAVSSTMLKSFPTTHLNCIDLMTTGACLPACLLSLSPSLFYMILYSKQRWRHW